MRKKTLISLLAFLLIMSSALLSFAQGEYVPDEVLVRFQRGASESVRQDIIHSVKGNIIKAFRQNPHLYHIKVESTIETDKAIEVLMKNPNVRYAARNNIHYASSTFPNDPRFNNQWALHNTGQRGGVTDADLDAPEAWDIFTGNSNIVVAVIDTGVEYTHEDLAANKWINPGETPGNGVDDDDNGYIDDIYGWDWVNDDNDPMDDHSHGTACAGVIGGVGDNGIGVTGINWDVQIMSLKVLNSSASGSSDDVISAIYYAADNGAHITSNSYGCYCPYNPAEAEAIEYANSKGSIFVAAAGNNGYNTDLSPHYPSSYSNENILSITGITKADAQIYNYGPTTVDMAGNTPEITTTYLGNSYTRSFSGTSAATPHVAGVAALVWGYEPGLEHTAVKTRLMDTVRLVPSLTGMCQTGGAVNAYNALSGGGPPPPPPDAPSNFVAAANGCDQINLTWQDNSDNENGFKIERSPDGSTFTQIDTVGADATSYNDTTVAESTTYWYRIRAYNAGGDSAYSNNASAATDACPGPPPAPSDLQAFAIACDQIDLIWTDNSTDEEGFVIERSTNNKKYKEIAHVGPNVTSYSDPGRVANKRYWYRVRAYNAYGNSGYSNRANATTPSCGGGPLAAPSGLTAKARGKDKIALSWNDNSSAENGFKIERSLDGAIFTVGANVTSYLDTGLKSKTTYHYRVRAYSGGDYSEYSDPASARTK